MNIGFIGTGAIAEALLTGWLTKNSAQEEVLVSVRNVERSQRLAKKFSAVRVEDDNQKIVDLSDWLFISVLPEQVVPLLDSLNFRDDQMVVSLVAGLSIDELKIQCAPVTKLFRIIPLPPVEFGLGPIPVFPPDPQLESWISQMGTPIPISNESHFTHCSAASASMASFFEWVASLARWMEAQGSEPETAADYVTSMIHALAASTVDADSSTLKGMAQECITKGGLNEQVLQESLRDNWFQKFNLRLDEIAKRLAD